MITSSANGFLLGGMAARKGARIISDIRAQVVVAHTTYEARISETDLISSLEFALNHVWIFATVTWARSMA